ncbi:sulfate permease [Aminipila butyrica]|uniref:Sulfate permease n=1 Tax=Aminipila butyrica TaxID=433296 RepID=A0A858BX89_9FIRM|nr:sulfate permease [Aminipila butyrica]QIB69510.1 sulfate permease [Aminipila butyrica]
MEKLKPKLFSVMESYNGQQFIKDVTAGIIVAIIALPLSIALAIASGVSPERGLYTAIIAGFLVSFFGGSRVQIGGPTAAFVVIVYGIIQTHGFDGLVIATIMAGIILIAMGFLRFGSLIKFIPYTITTGFTGGIAVGIVAGQIKEFLGLDMGAVPSGFIEKIKIYSESLHTIDLSALLIGAISLGILIFWPKITDKIPGSLIAIIVSVLLVKSLNLQIDTIGSVYGEISASLPSFHIPEADFKTILQLIQPAFTIAILAGIESLLSCVVSDGMIGGKHRSNMELIGQGIGNVFSGLFGGIPATGAIARTAANVKNGGRTPIAGIIHAITLLLILLVLMPLAALIPLSVLAAVLMMVAYNMSGWRQFVELLKTSPKSDIIVLVATFLLTVFFDLVIAIEVGVVLSSFLFMKRMSEVTEVNGWKYVEDLTDEDYINDIENIKYKKVPQNAMVYEISGPMFFAAAHKFIDITVEGKVKKNVLIIRMRSVPSMDVTALRSIQKIHKTCKKQGITLLFAHVQNQPMSVMKKAGFDQLIGLNNFLPHTDDALARAEQLKCS